MKFKALIPVFLALLAITACNGGGGSGGGGGGDINNDPGNKDPDLPPELQTYSYIANLGNSSISICKMTKNGLYRNPCNSVGTPDGVLQSPYAIAVNKENNTVFVTGTSSPSKIQNCTINPPDGMLTCGTQFTLPFPSPRAIALYYPANTSNKWIYITQSEGGIIWRCNLNANDQFDNSSNFSCTNVGQFPVSTNTMNGITVDNVNNKLYVSSGANNSIYMYTINPSNGNISSPKQLSNNRLNEPGKMAVGPSGYLYVSNFGTNTVSQFNENGDPGLSTSTIFQNNDGIAVNSLIDVNDPGIPKDTNSFAYVTNTGQNKGSQAYISKCTIVGNWITTCQKQGTGFNLPYGIAISGPVNPSGS